MFWGLSESLDLYQEYLNALKGTFMNGAPKDSSKSGEPQTDNDVAADAPATEESVGDAPVLSKTNLDADTEGPTEGPGEGNDNDITTDVNTSDNVDSNCNKDEMKISEQSSSTNMNASGGEALRNSNEDDEPQNERVVEIARGIPADIGAGDASTHAHEASPVNSNKCGEETAQIYADIGAGDASTHAPESAKCLNILILGAGDPRHLIRTMAKLYTHKGPDGKSAVVNFYVLEGCMELVARTIALLSIALESPESFNLLNKVHLFMDVYGNSLLRPSSHQYLVGKSKTLLKMITNDELLQQLAPLLDIEGLKYRERDGLENALNFLLPKEGHVFDVQSYWVSRVRKLLGTRFDHRNGAFDWDLNMVLKEREANQICSQEYRYWRETGIAFTYPEYEQCKPNKTLSVGLVHNGEKYLHRGYAGDIQTGPFCAFGLKCNDERMLKSVHGENDYRATDITERNLLEYFHELHTHTPYEHNVELSRKYGAVKLLMGKRLSHNECDLDAMHDYDKPWIPVDGVKVHFLSADDVFALQDEQGRWSGFFDVTFVGHNYFIFLKDSFAEVLKENALLILETKLRTMARKEEVASFEDKLKNYAKRSHMTPVINYNALNTKNSLLKFKKQRADGQEPVN